LVASYLASPPNPLSAEFLEDAAGGLLSPLGPSPLCDYMFISDNSLLLYIVQRLMISSLRAQDPHARTPDTVSSNRIVGKIGLFWRVRSNSARDA
jgi:hypothetical protein